MDNDKTRWAPRWSPKDCDSSWRFVVHKERAPGTDTSQDKTRREEVTAQLPVLSGGHANPLDKMQAHSLWARPPSSRPQPCVARLLPAQEQTARN
jgi:hypothetical protein